MADARVTLTWQREALRFEGRGPESAPIVIDGGGELGPTPMQTLLLSVAACSAADVVDILTKMRARPAGVEVAVEGDRAPEHPRRYTRMRLVYRVAGLGAEAEDKVRRAVTLSKEKYCSVLHTLRPDLALETEIVLG